MERKKLFLESGKKAEACIQDNINFTKFNDQCRLMQMDVMEAIRSLEGKGTFQIIFMDPPYNQELEKDVLLFSHFPKNSFFRSTADSF